MQFDETGPNTHTRRYWVSATIGIGAMIVFALLSILLLVGVVFGSPQVKPVADSLSRGRCWCSPSLGSRCSSRTRGLVKTTTNSRSTAYGDGARTDLH